MNRSIPSQIAAFLAAYLAACVAASASYTFFLALGFQLAGVAEPSDYTLYEHVRFLTVFTILVGLFVVTTAFLPTVAVVVLLRLVGLRDIVSHMVGGAAASAAAVVITARYVPLMNDLVLNWAMALAGALSAARPSGSSPGGWRLIPFRARLLRPILLSLRRDDFQRKR